MRTIYLLFITVLLGSTLSCEKRRNNNTAEQLDGSWEVQSVNNAEGEVDPSEAPQGVTLFACTVSDGPCEGVWIASNGDTRDFEWTVTERGNVFSILPLETSAISNEADYDIEMYKGEYTINEIGVVQFIVQKGETELVLKK